MSWLTDLIAPGMSQKIEEGSKSLQDKYSTPYDDKIAEAVTIREEMQTAYTGSSAGSHYGTTKPPLKASDNTLVYILIGVFAYFVLKG